MEKNEKNEEWILLRGTGTSENHSLKLGSARFHDDLETTKDRSATMGHQFLLLLLLLPFFLFFEQRAAGVCMGAQNHQRQSVRGHP